MFHKGTGDSPARGAGGWGPGSVGDSTKDSNDLGKILETKWILNKITFLSSPNSKQRRSTGYQG